VPAIREKIYRMDYIRIPNFFSTTKKRGGRGEERKDKREHA
jgi:hypothetical protein